MYRVAVIQNESEMLRSGFTNIIPKLRYIKRLELYSFEMFNIVNINELFKDGDNNLNHFDSLFVSTNATSDKAVLAALRNNKGVIEKFINQGKGVFISSQKKLSSAVIDAKSDSGKTLFLPDIYEFHTVIRPKIEKDSGEGNISVFNLAIDAERKIDDHILLRYPHKVTAELTTKYCEKNEFRRHFYRSHIIPQNIEAYTPIFVDTSYEDVKQRNLLMVNSVPQHGERIVVSTIAIDWEFHEELLTNIVCYITEGLPKVAFIDKAGVKNGDFDFLITTAKLSNVSYEIYYDADDIRDELFTVHNTYIFSPAWNEEDVTKFMKNIGYAEKSSTLQKKPYRRVYYFKQLGDIVTLNQFSNFSTIDLILDSAVLWLNSQFVGGMWAGSFWITYDVLLAMSDIGVDIRSYIIPIISDIKKHYDSGSYDGVMGATCGLLELVELFERVSQSKLQDIVIKDILTWITDKFSTQSNYDKQTAVITLEEIRTKIFGVDTNKLAEMKSNVCNTFHADYFNIESYTEMDLCKNISVCLLCGNREREIVGLLDHLRKNQTPSGKWTNTGRTAHVLVFLLKNLKILRSKISRDINVDDMIYNGILFLRSQYNWQLGNWDNDLQATAKATQAIGLYNDMYKYSTQDFFKTLETESDKIYSASVIHNISEGMAKLRSELSAKQLKLEGLLDTNAKRQVEIEELARSIETYKTYEEACAKEVKTSRTVATISACLLVGVMASLVINHLDILLKMISEAGSILAIVISFVITLILTGIAERTFLKSEVVSRSKNK